MSELTQWVLVQRQYVLLHGLIHRINNAFSSAISAVSSAAARSPSNHVKVAFSNVRELLHRHVGVHHALQMLDEDRCIDAADIYVSCVFRLAEPNLITGVSDLYFWPSPCGCMRTRAGGLVMIVHELVNNAAQHAFGDD